MCNSFWTHRRIHWLICLMAIAPLPAGAASLLGDHTCAQWMGMEASQKVLWADSFLAPLSLTIKSLRREKHDPYNDDSKSSGNAVTFIDDYCTRHPERVAADGAGEYFKIMMNQ